MCANPFVYLRDRDRAGHREKHFYIARRIQKREYIKTSKLGKSSSEQIAEIFWKFPKKSKYPKWILKLISKIVEGIFD